MEIRYILLIFLSSILIYGCGGSNSGSEQTTALEGTWIKSCSLDNKLNLNDPDVYSAITLTYEEAAKIQRETKTYQDSSCSVPTTAYNPPDQHPDNWENPISTASGQFFLYETITTTEGLQATKIFTTYSKITGNNIALDDYNIFYINADTMFIGNKTAISNGVFPNTLDLTREYIKQ